MKRLLLLALKFLTIFFTYFHTTNAVSILQIRGNYKINFKILILFPLTFQVSRNRNLLLWDYLYACPRYGV